ncbi:hypothetical protein BDN67DRAFT_868323, partial [Paxillus ammoniavirescens]
EQEEAYQTALQESYTRESQYKSALLGMQSTVMLQSMYCDGLSEQLAAQEEKRKQAKKGQLNGDGLPRLLTSDKFHKCVVEHHKANEDEAITRENHQRQWDA